MHDIEPIIAVTLPGLEFPTAIHLKQKSNKKNQGYRKMAKIFFVPLQQKSLKLSCSKIIKRRLVKEFCEEPSSFCCLTLHSENLSRS
jgi:hypothetical protein